RFRIPIRATLVHNRRRAERSTRIARGRLHKHPLEGTFAFDSSIGDTIKRYAAGHAKILTASQLVQVLKLIHQDFLEHILETARQIFMEVEDLSPRLSRRMAKQT